MGDKIDGDLSSGDREDAIRRIQQYQSEQDQQTQVDAAADAERTQNAEDVQSQAQQQSEELLQSTDGQIQLEQQDLDLKDSEQVSGVEASAQAVDTAQAQEERGLAWTEQLRTDDREIPPDVGDASAQGGQSGDQDSINVGDLLDQMKIQSGKIGA